MIKEVKKEYYQKAVHKLKAAQLPYLKRISDS